METRNLTYWTELVCRRRNRVFSLGALVFGLVAIATIFWPPDYRSAAEIMVQDSRAQLLVSPDLQNDSPERPAVVANPITEEDLNSERELLTSNYLVRQAITGLRAPAAYEGPGSQIIGAFDTILSLPGQGYRALHEAPTMTPGDRWADALAQHLDSSVIKRSNVIEVTFSSHDPAWSQKFLSLLLNHYLEVHARISHDPQAEQFFQQQAKLLQGKLAVSEQQLRAFQLQTGISDLVQQRQVLINRLSELELKESKNTAQLASDEEQVAALEGLRKNTPERIAKEVRSVQDLALSQLKPQVMQLKTQRADLLSRYQPNSQRIREIDAQLAAAQKILDHENHLEVSERSTDLNPTWVTIDSDLSGAKTSAAAGKATEDKLADEIRKVQDRLSFFVKNETESDRLGQQVDTDRQAYLSYVRKAEEARAAGGLNTNKILDISVSRPPELPLRPVFPIVWLNLAVGFVLAAGLGIAAAEFDERRDPKIYSTVTIERETGLQTVAVFADEG